MEQITLISQTQLQAMDWNKKDIHPSMKLFGFLISKKKVHYSCFYEGSGDPGDFALKEPAGTAHMERPRQQPAAIEASTALTGA